MNKHELRVQISNQKLTNQPFFFKSRIYLDEKLVEAIMPRKVTEAFKNYLEATDGHFEEASTIIKEADMFIKTERKLVIKVN